MSSFLRYAVSIVLSSIIALALYSMGKLHSIKPNIFQTFSLQAPSYYDAPSYKPGYEAYSGGQDFDRFAKTFFNDNYRGNSNDVLNISSRTGYTYRGFGSSNPVSKSDSLGLANTLYDYDYYDDQENGLHDGHEDNFLIKILKYLRGDNVRRNDECYGDYCDYYYDDGYKNK